eukprot:TRINITY_DN56427_c0_g1_i1.p1 TRINITY_DN56427_c0_g1~~TRINITY_DN56427_c0_g1_i1.p1  ORF type:complete len:603 (+),score=103.33 TRINITY_DN56427_c0_g1_i1:76-1809(+)
MSTLLVLALTVVTAANANSISVGDASRGCNSIGADGVALSPVDVALSELVAELRSVAIAAETVSGTSVESNGNFQGLRSLPSNNLSDVSPETVSCIKKYETLFRRTRFFQKITTPKDTPKEVFQQMLMRGGIHPRGVVLDSEFFELPLRFNVTALQADVKSLETEEAETVKGAWEGASDDNLQQGVVSTHLRLSKGFGSDHDSTSLRGPFHEALGGRSNTSILRRPSTRYLRRAIRSLGGGPVGNAALMRVEPGGLVDTHLDMNSYWFTRVRVHIPIQSDAAATFTVGQRDDSHTLHMEPGKAYVFDNHLGHSVLNAGATPRIHLAVDLVGSRRFWDLIAGARRIGSAPRPAAASPIDVHIGSHSSKCGSGDAESGGGFTEETSAECPAFQDVAEGNFATEDGSPTVLLEAWDDETVINAARKTRVPSKGRGCRAIVDALVEGARPVLRSRPVATIEDAVQAERELRRLADAWCDLLARRGVAESKKKSRSGKGAVADTEKHTPPPCEYAPLKRSDEIDLLQRLTARWECSGGGVRYGSSLLGGDGATVRDVVDAVSELHRVDEASSEYNEIGGEKA